MQAAASSARFARCGDRCNALHTMACPALLHAEGCCNALNTMPCMPCPRSRRLRDPQVRLSAAGTRGVFEDRLPPELNAALQLGCVAVVAPGARKRTLGAGFELSELSMRPVVQVRRSVVEEGGA